MTTSPELFLARRSGYADQSERVSAMARKQARDRAATQRTKERERRAARAK